MPTEDKAFPSPNDPPELWRWVVGYEGLYKVSNYGRVMRAASGRGAQPMHVLKQSLGTCKYMQVALSKNSKQRTKRVHRLVAEAFLEPVEGKTFVNHIDGNKLNNKASNLEWCTKSENAIHSYRVLGNTKPGPSIEQKRKKLSDEQILDIYTSEGTYAEIARKHNISDVMARNIKLGICWSDVTCRLTV